MNFTPFTTQLAGSIPAAAMHHFTTAKFAQNITGAPGNGTQLGQVVGVLSGGEGGVHYLRPVEGSAGFQALPHQATQQQLITLPITIPGAKPGDPQQTVQIQVMNPNVSALSSQVSMHQPKYHIQSFPQSEIGTVLTVAYPPQDGSEGVQILGNGNLPEGIEFFSDVTQGLQVVAAIQPQDVQMLTAHLPVGEHMVKSQNSDESNQQQQIQITTMLPNQQMVTVEDVKKSNNNNNTTFRIKQENTSGEESSKEEGSGGGGGQIIHHVQQGGQQWTITAPNVDLPEYLSRMPGLALQQYLKFNTETKNESGSETQEANQKDTKEDEQQLTEEVEIVPTIKTKKKKKYKKKPPKPKKPKPGQVVIATALDGTLLYCCPECHMAYPEKEFLEQHLAGHKIERRYICGICGAGLKRREHLERHKLGHNPARPYVCSVCLKGFKRKEHLNLHFVIHSGEKTEICQECGKGFYRKDHLRKHARSHIAKRAREEMVAQQQQTQGSQQSGSNDSNKQSSSTTTLISNIQPEMTILEVPTSTLSGPIQISLPRHLVSIANNSSGTETINVKQEMEGMMIQ
ncbi:uncharacterized protein LOC143921185 isoform X2 [Arctopsyche grandis]|uniref:uncharacterized protein LOC143921185 isoform X2 n=1 Tax=Arctopsyche grandis TaxID=121162 RepID=UPI00406D7C75